MTTDSEPGGRLSGYLQCQPGSDLCAWADYSGIIAVSQFPPRSFMPVLEGPALSEKQLAVLTKSFRDTAELLRHRTSDAR